ncbi:MAG: LamG domain-containing protein [Nanoarchaeota archaeon]
MQRRGLLIGDKKGLSDVVTTVLLILLVLAGVAIMWVVIRQFIIGTTSQLSASALTTSFTILPGVTDVVRDGSISSVKFNLRRDQGGSEARVSVLKVILRDSSGKETALDYNVPGGNFKELETLPITIDNPGSTGLAGRITSVKVQPVLLLPDGTNQPGSISAEQQVQEGDHLVLNKIIAWYGFDEVNPWTPNNPTISDTAGSYQGLSATPVYSTGQGSVAQSKSSFISGSASAEFLPSGSGTTYITLPAVAADKSLDLISTGITFAVWLKPADLTSQVLLISGQSGNAPGAGYGFGMNVVTAGTSSQSSLAVGAAGSWKESAKGAFFDPNRWTFVVISITPSGGSCKFYVDGVLRESTATGCPTMTSFTQVRRIGVLQSTVPCSTTNCRITTGTSPNTNSFMDYKGLMDELMLFNKDLSDQEIKDLYTYFNKRRSV